MFSIMETKSKPVPPIHKCTGRWLKFKLRVKPTRQYRLPERVINYMCTNGHMDRIAS